jgi:hypothetical protein
MNSTLLITVLGAATCGLCGSSCVLNEFELSQRCEPSLSRMLLAFLVGPVVLLLLLLLLCEVVEEVVVVARCLSLL